MKSTLESLRTSAQAAEDLKQKQQEQEYEDRLIVKIPVMMYKTGNGKVLYSAEVRPDMVRKVAIQVERTHFGVRTIEMVGMDRDKYDKLPFDQRVILEIPT